MPNHLPTLIVTPHGQPNHVLYTYLHTEENRVNYLLTPSPQGDLCVAKLFPPPRPGQPSSTATLPTMSNKQPPNSVRCEASRDLRWTIENTGVMSPIYKIVNQDDTPLYQISKPNPHAEFWTMFYFKYAGHQIPPKRIEFGKISKNPPEKGGGTRLSITGKSEDEKQVWQTLGVGNEDCVEWVVCCACLNLLDDEILRAAEKRANPNSAPSHSPASTAPASSPASTTGRPNLASLQRVPPSSGPRSAPGAGIASSAPLPGQRPPMNLAQSYRQAPPQQQSGGPPMRPHMGQQQMSGMGMQQQQQQRAPQGYAPMQGQGQRRF
ncbi:hypothetical protein B9479_003699 [Cryptococcus floricola]|uniref:Uncharacterized protein n=1 Tax=Cryptococcus floricola TaxID=2591691 RepID=A0A5D3AZ55_9TREE|nr:hypothetical protein B9479_003699 [Cryptococcus floricola]